MTDVTITLRGEVAEKLLQLVADEHYARPEEAVADALDALSASRDPALDAWLRETIAARADAFEADPSRGLTSDQLRARLAGQG